MDFLTFMQSLGFDTWPQRWEDWYPEVQKEYDSQGCIWTDAAPYAALEAKYGCFGSWLEPYQQAAQELSQHPDWTVLLMLMARSLADPARRAEDVAAMPKILTDPPTTMPLSYRMLPGLAICTQLEATARLLTARHLPPEQFADAISAPARCAGTYQRLHHGMIGYDHLKWALRHLDGKLFHIGILEIEMLSVFREDAAAFRGADGSIRVLWQPVRTEQGWKGLLCSGLGETAQEETLLDASDWQPVLQQGDSVIRLHIPRNHRLLPQAVDETLSQAKDFAKTCFPELDCRAFVCGSWLLSTQLPEILDESTNIVQFSRRFFRLHPSGTGNAVFNFIFCTPMNEVVLENLPERTSLERGLKQYYLSGQRVIEQEGFILI